ncbi:MAG: mitomycin antibiotics/polyketide fumonisin biosynthesis protein [Candidatus Latescibacteria bacterium]|nr:mitomycin antibiotics/polyketide fumonisin biosynthesis protein [Candidatus Latescibacterota bacterium]
MDDKETYLFDLQGYLLVEKALDSSQIDALDTILEERIASAQAEKAPTHRFGGLLEWGKPYRDLIDNPTIVPHLEALLGARFRLDHVYLDIIRTGLSPIGATLHGGATPFAPSQYYHYRDGRMHNGLTVVAYNLRDVGPEDGGFGCVPGSHKSNKSFPAEWRAMDKGLHPCITRVTGPAGSAVVFTEALTHGALPWTGAGERRTIFFKYSPHPVSWAAGYFDEFAYDDLSERQRDILEAPNARYGGRKKQ